MTLWKNKLIYSLQSVWVLSYNHLMIIDISHISKLANLPIASKEKIKFEKQLSAILEHFKKLSEVVTDNIDETNQVTGLINIVRPDEISLSLPQSEVLKNSKNTQNDMFTVPVILQEGIEP